MLSIIGDAKLEAKLKSYASQMELLNGGAGVSWMVSATVIAEIGIKMRRRRLRGGSGSSDLCKADHLKLNN